MRRRVLLVVPALAAIAACSKPEPQGRPVAPELVGELLGGGTYNLADQRGQVVVVNFWASWCGPCRAEIDDLEATYQSTKDQGVSFVGININDERDKALAFVDGRVSYPSVFDGPGKLSINFAPYGATTVPATVIVDREGRIAQVLRNAVRRDTLEPLVAKVAEEPRP